VTNLTDFQKGVLDLLQADASIFADRAEVYKDNYAAVGRVMEALFPDGHSQNSQEDHNRWHLFELVIVKLTRYVMNYDSGGHKDSLKDMRVYLAMLERLDAEAVAEHDGPRDLLQRFPSLGPITGERDKIQAGTNRSSQSLPSFSPLHPAVELVWWWDGGSLPYQMDMMIDDLSYWRFEQGKPVFLKHHLDNANPVLIDHFDPSRPDGMVVAIHWRPEDDVTWAHPSWISHKPVSLQSQVDAAKDIQH
jgi:hypothetical protein